ncbi:UPF0598 protein F59C6.12 [Diplonema papillatum]|nr:UPF0598 protein F59C6.12 [Diplonema papillatum]
MRISRVLLAEAAGPRRYYYYLNDHGHLYHLYHPEELIRGHKIPKGPAHMREAKFLDFFFTRLRRRTAGDAAGDPEAPPVADFPFVSHCKGEFNYMRPADRPVVYLEIRPKELVGADEVPDFSALTGDPDRAWVLTYGGGSLYVPFDPAQLHVCEEGRVYYPAPAKKHAGDFGLLSCYCALRLGLDSIWEDPDAKPELHWGGKTYPLIRIPAFPDKLL